MSEQSVNSKVASLRQEEQEAQDQLRSQTLLQRAIWRIKRDPLTLSSLAVLLFLAIASYSAPIIVDVFLDIDYNEPDAYNGKLPLGARVLDSESTMLQWTPETGEFRRSLIAHRDHITALDMSPDGELYVTVSDDSTMRVWQTVTGRNRGRVAVLEDDPRVYTAASFAPSSLFHASGDNLGYLSIWDTLAIDSTGEVQPIYRSEDPVHEGTITTIDYLIDGTVITGGEDGWVRLWDATTYDLIDEIEVGASIANVAASTTAEQFTIVADQSFQIWGAAPLEEVTTGEADAQLNIARYSPDGETVLIGDSAGNVTVYTVESGENLATFEHPDAVNDVRFLTTEETQIVTAGEDGVTRIWDIETGEIVQEFRDEERLYPVTHALMTQDGGQMITATEGRERFYVLGTDTSGRDHLSRLLYAGQISLMIGFAAAIGALTIGVIVGVIAGYFGGPIDDFIIWVVTTMDSIPGLYLLLIVSAFLAPNATSLIFILVILGWTGAARIVRGETFALREREFVMAARALGAKPTRIMFSHIVPNVVSVLLIALGRSIGGLILAESSLSFLGFGVKPPTPSWGNMLAGDLGLLREAPHLVIAPGLLITVTVLCLYIIGDGLRDAFDPNFAD